MVGHHGTQSRMLHNYYAKQNEFPQYNDHQTFCNHCNSRSNTLPLCSDEARCMVGHKSKVVRRPFCGYATWITETMLTSGDEASHCISAKYMVSSDTLERAEMATSF